MKKLRTLTKDKTFLHGALITIAILFLLRIFYSVPTPGININYFKDIIESNGVLGLMNVLSGNGFSNISIMMLNITPYITASIIIQLLGNVFKKIHDMQHGMRDEQKKLEHITIVLGVILAAVEGVAIAVGYGHRGLYLNYTWYWVAITVAIWSFGTTISSILGKMIQDKYKFNGISLILVCNILAGYISDGGILYEKFLQGKEFYMQVIIGIAILILILALFTFTYFVQDTERTIRVQHAGKSNFIGNSQMGELPIKLCPGSVVPIIFASSIMTTPTLIASAFTEETPLWMRILSSNYWFNPSDWLPSIGVILYILLIFGFSFFYADMTLDAKEIAENFKKNGSVIPGIRPGKSTEEYIKNKVHNTVSVGAIALILIALVPIILSGLFQLQRIAFLGTSVIIVVGVFVEIKNMLNARAKQGLYINTGSEGGLF